MQKRKWIKVIGLSVAAIALLGGCGTKSSTTDQTKSSTSSQATKQEASITVPTDIVTLDTTQMTDKNTFTIAQQLFEGLYRLDSQSKPVPALAKSVDISGDKKTYTFHLRKNLKWSNGTALTSADFLYAWRKLVDPSQSAPNAYLLDNVKNGLAVRKGEKAVSELGVSAPDAQTFKVELTQAQSSFLTLISIAWLAPQNQAYVEKQGKAYATDSQHVLTSGPFTIADWTQGGSSWVLKKNPEYHAASAVKLNSIKGESVKEEGTGLKLFDAGETDLAKVSGQNVEQYQDNPAYVSHQDIANYFLDFNKKSGTPLANTHLRKAIAQAIDKQTLTKNILNDGAKPLNGLIPKNLNQNAQTKQDFRAYSGNYLTYSKKVAQKEWQKAQAELGEKVTVSLLVADDTTMKNVAEYIQSQLQNNLSGLTVKIETQPKNNVNQARRDKDYEISLSGWIAGDNALSMYFILYESTSGYNYGSYSNKVYDEAVTKAKTTDAADANAQFKDYKTAETELLTNDAALVPLYQSSSNYLINPKLKAVAYPKYGGYFNFREAYFVK